MAKDLILYRTKAACEIKPDAEKGIFWISFAEGNGEKPVKGQRKYDWESKITLALSVEEATNLSLAARMIREGEGQDYSIYHNPAKSDRCEGAAKILALSPGNGSKALAFLSVKQGDKKVRHRDGRRRPVATGDAVARRRLQVAQMGLRRKGGDASEL